MRKISYSPENFTQRALDQLEPDVALYSFKYTIKGLDTDDVAQELRWQLYRKFHLYDASKSSPRTWAWRVMRNRLTDMSRYRNDLLDHENRKEYTENFPERISQVDDKEELYLF